VVDRLAHPRTSEDGALEGQPTACERLRYSSRNRNCSASIGGENSKRVADPSSPSRLRLLFKTALQDYEKLTGTKLADHPLAKQLETCGSVESIIAVFQEQAQAFREFQGDDGKVMKLLNRAVNIMYALSISTVLGKGIGLAHRHKLLSVARFLTPIQ